MATRNSARRQRSQSPRTSARFSFFGLASRHPDRPTRPTRSTEIRNRSNNRICLSDRRYRSPRSPSRSPSQPRARRPRRDGHEDRPHRDGYSSEDDLEEPIPSDREHDDKPNPLEISVGGEDPAQEDRGEDEGEDGVAQERRRKVELLWGFW